jgi:hypothetical protein
VTVISPPCGADAHDGMTPDFALAVPPRIDFNVHVPSGPSTRSFSGRSQGFPAGHSFGDL